MGKKAEAGHLITFSIICLFRGDNNVEDISSVRIFPVDVDYNIINVSCRIVYTIMNFFICNFLKSCQYRPTRTRIKQEENHGGLPYMDDIRISALSFNLCSFVCMSYSCSSLSTDQLFVVDTLSIYPVILSSRAQRRWRPEQQTLSGLPVN